MRPARAAGRRRANCANWDIRSASAPRRSTFLDSVLPADIRRLRGQVAEALFEADRHLFARVAALSKAAPVAIAAKLAEHAFSPLLGPAPRN